MARRIKKLTKEQAIVKLTETRSLSTDLLEPLRLSFESWLRFCQQPKETREKVVADLIEYYNGDNEHKTRMVSEAQAKKADR